MYFSRIIKHLNEKTHLNFLFLEKLGSFDYKNLIIDSELAFFNALFS